MGGKRAKLDPEQRMMTKLVKSSVWAERFYEYVDVTTRFEKSDQVAACKVFPKKETLFQGCRSKKHSQVMWQLTTEYSMSYLLDKWEEWHNSMDEARKYNELSMQTKEQFKHGDKVQFVGETAWKGKYGIVLMEDDLSHIQCVVQGVKVNCYGVPIWDENDGSCQMCGHYQDLTKV